MGHSCHANNSKYDSNFHINKAAFPCPCRSVAAVVSMSLFAKGVQSRRPPDKRERVDIPDHVISAPGMGIKMIILNGILKGPTLPIILSRCGFEWFRVRVLGHYSMKHNSLNCHTLQL